jgi:hypothetical protein
MGQVTEATIAMFKKLLNKGEHINSTHSEEAQLVDAWEKLHLTQPLRDVELRELPEYVHDALWTMFVNGILNGGVKLDLDQYNIVKDAFNSHLCILAGWIRTQLLIGAIDSGVKSSDHGRTPLCSLCNDRGTIGGPSFNEPDEGGVPCPDCVTRTEFEQHARGVGLDLNRVGWVYVDGTTMLAFNFWLLGRR